MMGWLTGRRGERREAEQRRASLERVSEMAGTRALAKADLVRLAATELEQTLHDLMNRNDELTGRRHDDPDA